MYIPGFACGVIATILVETVLLVGAAIYQIRKKKQK